MPAKKSPIKTNKSKIAPKKSQKKTADLSLKEKNFKNLEKYVTKLAVDSDCDGLSDYQEYLYGTDPYNPDSDGDKLMDYEEIKIYGTDPRNPDTNNNGIPDGEEVMRGLNPKGKGKLKDYFVPYSGNDYEPDFLKTKRIIWYGSTAILVKAIVVLTVIFLPLSAYVTPDIAAQQAKKIIELTNDVRSNLKLPLLKENSQLNQAALAKAQDMVVGQYFAHINPQGRDLNDWLKQFKYDYAVAGENLAMGFTDASDVVNAWSKSKTHYANMIDKDFTEIGVALAIGKYNNYETTFVTQYFGSRNEIILQDNRVNNTTTSNLSITSNKSKVLGVKIFKDDLIPPILVEPQNNFSTKSAKVSFKVFAPGADKINLFDNGNLINVDWQNNDGYFTKIVDLNEGVNNLILESVSGQEKINSEAYLVTIDSIAPKIDQAKTKIMVAEPNANGQKIVLVNAFLSPDTIKAEVTFSNYRIELSPEPGNPEKWVGSAVIFPQQEEQIFNPVVLASLSASDALGNSILEDIKWDNIVPVKPSVLTQYFFIKESGSKYIRWLFDFSTIYYKVLLGIVLFVLALKIFIKIKKQNYKLILVSLSFAALLLILILF